MMYVLCTFRFRVCFHARRVKTIWAEKVYIKAQI